MAEKPTYEELKQRVKELETEASERKLLENELILKSIVFEMSIAANSTADNEGMINHVNPTFLKMWGYETKEEVIGNPVPHFFQNPDDAIPVLEALNKSDFWRGEFKAKRKDGSIFISRGLASSVRDAAGHQIGYYSANIDVTEQKQAEDEIKELNATLEQRVVERTIKLEATNKQLNAEITERKRIEETLLESEEKFRFLTEQNLLGIIIIQDGLVKYVNEAASEITEYSIEEALDWGPNEFGKLFHSDDLKFVMEQAQKKQKGAKDVVTHYSYRIITKSKKVRWVDQYSKPITFEGKNADFITIIDITEHKRAEEALRESEKKYRQLFDSERDAIMVFDAETMLFEEANKACLDLYGYAKDEFFRLSPKDLSAQHEETEKALKHIIHEKGLERIPLRYQKKKDGTVFPVEITSGTFDIKGRKKIIGAIRDISERIEADQKRKTLESQLLQSQKMESIGTMAGGIAHDFNNILGIIIGNTELAIDDVPEWNPAKGCLEEIRSASLRAKDVVRHILSFARKSVTERKPLEITPVIKDSLKLLRASIPKTIEISQDFSCKHDTILADPIQINQVLMNLCTNASHAMREKGGVLEVILRNVELEMGNEELDLEPGRYVKLTVSDTGPGIDSGIIARIFDPYFTTKGLGEGTGMGLSVVHGIVKNHDGALTVKSEPGKGAVFEAFFPLTEAEAEPEAKEADTLPTGNERILFVDDEAALVKMGRRMLERLGYQVETKTNPIEALELVRSEPDRFDLIITDMTMPQMTGDNLVKEILSIRPDMPIILCTGFSEKIDDERAEELGISKYIEKPFTTPDFPIAVRNVLDAGRSEG